MRWHAGMIPNVPSHSNKILPLLAVCSAFALGGCLHVTIEPMEVNARVQMDVTLRADRVIEQYLGELNRRREALLQETP